MSRDHLEFQERSTALAYLITFRCYGTWLHGDERGSVGRQVSNQYGHSKIAANRTLLSIDKASMGSDPFILDVAKRAVVEKAIKEVCEVRNYLLYALNVRTNHAHIVVNNGGKVERMMDTFKAYSTRGLRAAGLIDFERRPWSRHGSTRYLWTEEHISFAVDYVSNGQGDELPRFD